MPDIEDKRVPVPNNITIFDENSVQFRLVIDEYSCNPLRDFEHIPIMISSDVEGFRLEAWLRLEPHLSNADLLQRQPPALLCDYYAKAQLKDDGNPTKQDLFPKNA